MTTYPGHDKEFFVVLNEVITGPIVGLQDLSVYDIRPDTPVWYEGLDDWQPAIMAPLTRQLFTPDSEYYRALSVAGQEENPPTLQPEPPTLRPAPEPQQPVAPAPRHVEEPAQAPFAQPLATETETIVPARPNSYLVWAIIVTVIFNLICGVIALIYSFKVRSKYRKGNYAGAERCSNTVQWWIAVGIVLGLIMTVARMFIIM